MSREEVVVGYINGELEVPAHLKSLVEGYGERRRVADACASYPRSVDLEMDALYDAMVVLAE